MNRASQPLLPSDELRQWTQVSRTRNLLCVGLDYFFIVVIHLANLYAIQKVGSWWFMLPFGTFTIFMTGCLIHRIGLLGHEASHGLLYPNRISNDLLSDLLCFYPLWSSTNSYRKKHLGHHLHPNDPDQDPNMAGDKTEALYARFPMTRPTFIWNYYAKFFWPPFVLMNLLDLFRMLSFGRTPDSSDQNPGGALRLLGSPTVLGMIFLLVYVIASRRVITLGDRFDLVAAQLLLVIIGIAVWEWIPESRFSSDKRKSHASPKNRALIRLLFYTTVVSCLAWARVVSGFQWGGYYLLFWIFPLIYVFPYLMLLREIYQHANLGQGRLDNSRIIHADPFTRWALLSYGNDYHLVHHIYPNIPHYHLRKAHQALIDNSSEYRDSINETKGTFQAPDGEIPLLESLAKS